MLKPQAQKSNHVAHEDGTGNKKKRKNKIKCKKNMRKSQAHTESGRVAHEAGTGRKKHAHEIKKQNKCFNARVRRVVAHEADKCVCMCVYI